VDANGNLLIADSFNNVIRKVGTNGIISTVVGNGYGAGTGNGAYSGDGGAATNAELWNPTSVAIDATGNLFIADTYNNVIREVGTNGIISTVAGSGTLGRFGDGGVAINAALYNPHGVAVDATGNLFIADQHNNRIRKVGTNGIINTVAGNGTWGYSGDDGAATIAELSDPSGVAVDATGNLFISDSFNNVIRKVGINGIISTVVGNGYGAGTGYGAYSGDGGGATNAALSLPGGVAVDTTGSLFIADTDNNRIREVVFPGPILVLNDVGVGNTGAYDVVVSGPYGSVTSSVINLTVIVPLQVTTIVLPSATNGVTYNQTLSASGGQTPFNWTNSSGALPTGLHLSTNGVISGTPSTAGTFNFVVKVTDALSNTATQALSVIVLAPPSIVAFQPTNSSLTIPFGNNVTFSVSVAGTGPFSYQWQLNGTNLPNGPNGIITTVAGGYVGEGVTATNASLKAPMGLTKDNYGNLLIADTGHHLIRKVGANGIITTVAGNGNSGYSGDGGVATDASLSNPQGVVMDASGNLFVSDTGNNLIRRVDTNGIITTVAGGGSDAPGNGEAATNVFMEPNGSGARRKRQPVHCSCV
jgi:sugar lactone lactonase YvrE